MFDQNSRPTSGTGNSTNGPAVKPHYIPALHQRGLLRAVIRCSVQQPVVVVVHAATASDQDGEKKGLIHHVLTIH